MRADIVAILLRAKPQTRRQTESHHRSNRNRFAVNQRGTVTRRRFQRMAESVAEIEQRTLPRFAFIRRNEFLASGA